MLTELPISHGFFRHPDKPWTSQTCQNLYPELAQSAALANEALLPTPGLAQVAQTVAISSYACRGAWRLNDVPYFVQGPTLYRLNADETVTSIGAIEGAGRVWMAENGTQLIIVTGRKGYIYDGSLEEITDIDYDEANGVPQSVCYLDGYFVTTTDNNRITVSELNDGKTWRALDFATAESSPDGLVCSFAYKNQLFIGGTRTIEQWTNIGGADFPFQRTNLFIDRGITAPHSVVNVGDVVLFLGSGDNQYPAVWALADGAAQKVSNHAVDYELDKLTPDERRSVFAWSYMLGGHHFYCLSLPNETFVFDLATNKWHTRISRVSGDNDRIETGRCRVNALIEAYGALYVGDQYDGRIGKLDPGSGTEYGQPVLREFSTQPYNKGRGPFVVPILEVGMTSGGGGNVTLECSRDGGRTWSDPRSRSMGEIGEYQTRTAWRRIGRIKDTIAFRIRSASASRVAFYGLWAEIV